MTIDPRWSFYLTLALAVLGFLGGAGSQFTDLGLSPTTIKELLAGDALILGLGNTINAVFAAMPSKTGQTAGFYLGPKDPATKP